MTLWLLAAGGLLAGGYAVAVLALLARAGAPDTDQTLPEETNA